MNTRNAFRRMLAFGLNRNRIRSVAIVLIVVSGFVVKTPLSEAGSSLALKHYGQGVHLFHQGRYQEAIARFDLASSYDNRDPRIYYFRGLSKQRAGRAFESTADFQMGAQLEAALGTDQVGWALERVQGAERMVVERYRREAKKLAPELVQSLIPQPLNRPADNQDSISVPPQRPIVPRVSQTHSTFRLPSLPDDQSDPFAASADTLLGQGPIIPIDDSESTGAPSTDPAPFGTGVVQDEAAQEEFPNEDLQDDFAADEPAGNTGTDSNGQTERKRGIFGAAIRAFTRSVTPDVLPQQIPGLDGLRPQNAEVDGSLDAGVDDDPFGAEFGFDDPPPEDEPTNQDQLGDPFEDDSF